MRTSFFWGWWPVTSSRPPAGLGKSGRALWRGVTAQFGFHPHEAAILAQCCRIVDRLDLIEAELTAAGALTVQGSTGQPRAHPLLAEWRSQARTLELLCRALSIPLPGEDEGKRRSPTARDAARERWRRNGVA